MTVAGEQITDAELNALLDGELSARQEARIRNLLAGDRQALARLEDYRAVNEQLRAVLDPVLEAPVPSRLLLATGGLEPRREWIGVALAAGLLLGLVGGWWLALPGDRAAPAVIQSAFSAHVVYLPEIRHPVEVGATQRAHLNAWLSKRLNHDLEAPDLGGHGLTLVGGRLLPDAGVPAAQFMYETDSGERLTVYCRLEAHDAEWALRYARSDGAGLYYWAEDGMSYAVVADMDQSTLKQIAADAHPQL